MPSYSDSNNENNNNNNNIEHSISHQQFWWTRQHLNHCQTVANVFNNCQMSNTFAMPSGACYCCCFGLFVPQSPNTHTYARLYVLIIAHARLPHIVTCHNYVSRRICLDAHWQFYEPMNYCNDS